jgi:hypothetical protein
MAKGGKVGPAVPANNNGGIMGSGIFGMFGSTVVCKSDDTSAFCTLSKIVNIITMVIFLILIIYKKQSCLDIKRHQNATKKTESFTKNQIQNR